jgi:hypothetical protein
MNAAQNLGGSVIPFPKREPYVPPFDPSNPEHVAAWRALFEFGRTSLQSQPGGRQ